MKQKKITELTKLLKAGEWNDVYLKESRMAVPKFAFETVSALANTHGGRLVFGDDSRLFEPGEKEVRNPAIAMAIRRIARCEQAGTGMRMMREEWQKLGHPAPTYKNDRAWKAFDLFIPDLDKEVDMASDLMKAMFADLPLEPRPESPTQSPTQSDDPVHRLLKALQSGDLSSGQLREVIDIKHRPTFRRNYLHPALGSGFIEYTIPEKPNSRMQKYRLTDRGRQALVSGEGGGE